MIDTLQGNVGYLEEAIRTRIGRWKLAWNRANPNPRNVSLESRRWAKRYDLALCGVIKDNWVAIGEVIEMRVSDDIGVHDDRVYRISIEGGKVHVLCLGMESVDSKLDGIYDGVNALPDWVQERIAVLMMTRAEPPTHEVVGVGRRIAKDVFLSLIHI